MLAFDCVHSWSEKRLYRPQSDISFIAGVIQSHYSCQIMVTVTVLIMTIEKGANSRHVIPNAFALFNAVKSGISSLTLIVMSNNTPRVYTTDDVRERLKAYGAARKGPTMELLRVSSL
jgi:hypothetical protein